VSQLSKRTVQASIIVLSGLSAAALPVWRVVRIDPLVALKYQ
jgi:hypothetical protein